MQNMTLKEIPNQATSLDFFSGLPDEPLRLLFSPRPSMSPIFNRDKNNFNLTIPA
jgi:hypothetical protein